MEYNKMDKSEETFVQFAELESAARANSWPKELSRVTDWDLMSLDQELDLVTQVYDHRNWTMLSKMLGCGVGLDFVELLLRWSCDASDNRTWLEFPVKLFWTQIRLPLSPRAVALETPAQLLLLLVFLTKHGQHGSYWDYVPGTLDLLYESSGSQRDANDNFFNNVVVQVFDYIMTAPCITGRNVIVDKLIQKWRIICRCVAYSNPLAQSLATSLKQRQTMIREMRALLHGAHEDGHYFAMDVLVRLQNLIPALAILLEDLRRTS